ncbi:alpha-L-arabinofuranosidase C-terminal domain-containing protein [Wenyingzhuangia sp. chi5]|uniref:non-reducing end alpha-L-arabinofuranosidase n=1 Tax=Wenyingzhuangia gilva TaxID=3057677 RepID=A0ABT8VTI5_9FLAO|nr:alpha-L-arabinofuranosidase C-terminal domain-containing protein [Wenyingzhuangia sp. chi5]MDO3695274.1 alpha-L-arabinofuranosidase C-terminal domain-containing protein [Wenyingzhuangia sp. chi5]
MNIKKIFNTLSFLLLIASVEAQNKPVQLDIDAGTQIATVTKLFNGTNIEDLNNQTNGGIFSQLLHGEIFEENVDGDFLNLERKDYSKIYILLDEKRIPHLITQTSAYSKVKWNDRNELYDVKSQDVYTNKKLKVPLNISGLYFTHRFMPFDSLSPNIQKLMLERINGNEQISKFWSKQVTGDPQFKYELIRDGNAYVGRQTQKITFIEGSGSVGLYNQGLYKTGIKFEKDKLYEGVLRVKSDLPTTIYLSIQNENGQILAEKPFKLKGNSTYEKVEFKLTPNKGTLNGRFGITLKEKGTIELGFAFLEPGEWGRVNGYHIRKEFVEALKRQGIKAIRYNGSMVDQGADKQLYHWKKMLGPIDERRTTLRNGFNMYATHSFGIIEMLQFTEAVGAVAIIGMSMDETAEDIRDFVEYVNGPITSKWGKLRAEQGHPEPYNLEYIQVDNERPISEDYINNMKKFATSAWKVDASMNIMTSLNIYDYYKRGSKNYTMASEMVKWFIEKGKSNHLAWDAHNHGGDIVFSDNLEWFENEMGIILQQELAKDFPGFKLTLTCMEENGERCDWYRGLAHASNWNTLQRYGNCFKMLGTANTFQPHGLHYMWDQGRIHYTNDAMWFQPSAHIDEMMMKTWKPNVVKTQSSNDSLDITAKINEDKTEMTLYVANMSNEPLQAILNISNFKYQPNANIEVIGDCDLSEYNTYEKQNNVVFRPIKAVIAKKNATYTFPRYSYTVITLKK